MDPVVEARRDVADQLSELELEDILPRRMHREEGDKGKDGDLENAIQEAPSIGEFDDEMVEWGRSDRPGGRDGRIHSAIRSGPPTFELPSLRVHR